MGYKGIQWKLPLNTSMALVYGKNDSCFRYEEKHITDRVKTGSLGLTCCYTSETEGHDLPSLWSEDGLPEIIKSTYLGDFSYEVMGRALFYHRNMADQKIFKKGTVLETSHISIGNRYLSTHPELNCKWFQCRNPSAKTLQNAPDTLGWIATRKGKAARKHDKRLRGREE